MIKEYYLGEDITRNNVCTIFSCSSKMLLKMYHSKHRSKIKYEIPQEDLDFVIEELNKDETITLNDMLSKVKNR